jgi:hypothetical protein
MPWTAAQGRARPANEEHFTPSKGSFAAALKSHLDQLPNQGQPCTILFDGIPHDLLVHIFSQLHGEALPAAAAVCRLWRIGIAAAALGRLPSELSWLHTKSLRQLQLYLAVHSNLIRSPRSPGPLTAWVSTQWIA